MIVRFGQEKQEGDMFSIFPVQNPQVKLPMPSKCATGNGKGDMIPSQVFEDRHWYNSTKDGVDCPYKKGKSK